MTDETEGQDAPPAEQPLEKIDKVFGSAIQQQQFEGIVQGFRRELDALQLKLNAANAKIEYCQSEYRAGIDRLDRTLQSLVSPQ